MKRTTRYATFETNSSSAHSFVYLDPQAYEDFLAGDKYILLKDASCDEWADSFRYIDESRYDFVIRRGQKYGDFSTRLIDEDDLEHEVQARAGAWGWSGNGPATRYDYWGICADDLDDDGSLLQEWIDSSKNYADYNSFELIEDGRGGVLIKASFRD